MNWRLYGAAALSAVLLALAFESDWLALLVLVALTPWFALIRSARRREAMASGSVFGAVLFAFQMWWVVPFTVRWTGNVGLAVLPWLVVLFLAAIVYSLLGLGLRWAIAPSSHARWRWVLVPMVWVSHEVLRAYLPELAFPWAFVSTPLVIFPWAVQHAAWGTMWLVSATVVSFNLAVLWSVEAKRTGVSDRRISFALAFALGVPVLASSRLFAPPPVSTMKVTLGQHGFDMAFGEKDKMAPALDAFTQRAVQAALMDQAELLVLPEGYSRTTATLGPPDTPLGSRPIVPVMFGSFRQEGDRVYQAAYHFDGEWSYADKTKLVVFGEYVPFRNVFPILKSFNLSPVDLTPGSELKVMTHRGKKLGPMVCFEGVFPELGVKEADLGAQAFVQMSIDDWYAGTQAHEQLWKSSVWRSIENGLPMVRVGSQGRSLVTDFRGRVQTVLPEAKPIARTVEVALPARSDAFPWRYWFAWLCAAVGLIVLALEVITLIWRPIRRSPTDVSK